MQLDAIKELFKFASLIPELRVREFIGHGYKVAEFSKVIAEELGVYSEQLYYAALLHDIGKILIPETILSKPTILEPEEIEVIKEHPIFSEKLLSEVPFLDQAKKWVRWHHEYVNGKGYPDGIPSRELPIEVRIIALANAFVSLLEPKPYRKPYPLKEAIEIIKKESGIKWDPEITKIALKKLFVLKDLREQKLRVEVLKEKKLFTPIVKLRAIYRIGEEIKNLDDVDNFFKRVLNIIKEVLKIEGKYFLLVNDRGSLKIVAQVGANDSLIGFKMPEGKGLSTFAFTHKVPVVVNDVSKDERFFPTPGEEIGSEIAVPLLIGNEAVGVIDIESNKKNSFTVSDRQFIEAVANTIAPVLKVAEMLVKLKELAFIDNLTGAYSYAYLENVFGKLREKAKEEKKTFALVFIDLDSLKKVNDTYGHLYGDKLLKLFVEVSKNSLRREDIVVRYGGDEFIVIVWDVDREGVIEIIERLKRKLEEESKKAIPGNQSHSFSYGISIFPYQGDDLVSLIKAADKEMYHFKAIRKGAK